MPKYYCDLGHFDIYKFEFVEYLRKEKNTILTNLRLFEIFWKYIEK